MPVTISVATPNEASEVFRLIHALAVYEKMEDEVRSDADVIRRAMEGDDPHIHVLLAREDGPTGRAVGFALYFFTFSTFTGTPTLYLEDLFVDPTSRGEGIGTLFLRRLAAIARERGCRRMEWTALDWNTTARTFYEHLGARPMESWIIHRLGEAEIGQVAGESESAGA